MINDLENEKIVLEIRELINNVDKAANEMNVYCEMMRQIFLSGSSTN